MATQAVLASNNPASSTTALSSRQTGYSETDFLQLLVAQLQNQDPLDPTDGTQFLSQLTEINSFEQLLYIRQDLDTISGQSTAAGGSAGGSGSSSSGSPGTPASGVSGSPNQQIS